MHNKKNLNNMKLFFASLLILGFASNGIVYSQNKIDKINLDQLKQIISKREGKPLLINLWATWCAPCREEFPDLVELGAKYKNKVDIVGISVDYPDEIDSKILPFVKKLNVNFTIYVNDVKDQEKLIDFFDKDWNGAIPATFIYDINGKNVSKIYGKKDFKYFESQIKKYFKK
jgi:thiol-disulfide isomerase/thioredoxin